MREILKFRRFTTPLFIAVIFWLGLILIFIAGIAIVFHENPELPTPLGARAGIALGWIILASLFWRVFCEVPMVIFRIYETLNEIREAWKEQKEGSSPLTE
ncbi:MAG: DUF4282 domain-containing protein [Candidatus Bipolaricaulaceae bacterium]